VRVSGLDLGWQADFLLARWACFWLALAGGVLTCRTNQCAWIRRRLAWRAAADAMPSRIRIPNAGSGARAMNQPQMPAAVERPGPDGRWKHMQGAHKICAEPGSMEALKEGLVRVSGFGKV
jgi:hypothetical protein